MKKVICISAKAQHGKDTTATILKCELEEQGNRVLIIHYADLLKYLCREYFNWDGAKDEVGRTLLQKVGTDIVRSKNPDYWVDFVIGFLKLFEAEWDYVLIPDCRFPNEVERMKSAFDAIHLRVVRSNFVSPLSIEQQNHPSEIALDNYPVDILIDNDTDVTHLGNKIIEIVKSFE